MQRNTHVFEKYELCYTIFACEAFYLDAEYRCHITVIDNGSVMYIIKLLVSKVATLLPSFFNLFMCVCVCVCVCVCLCVC